MLPPSGVEFSHLCCSVIMFVVCLSRKVNVHYALGSKIGLCLIDKRKVKKAKKMRPSVKEPFPPLFSLRSSNYDFSER